MDTDTYRANVRPATLFSEYNGSGNMLRNIMGLYSSQSIAPHLPLPLPPASQYHTRLSFYCVKIYISQ